MISTLPLEILVIDSGVRSCGVEAARVEQFPSALLLLKALHDRNFGLIKVKSRIDADVNERPAGLYGR